MSLRISEQDLQRLNQRFEQAAPIEILRFAQGHFGARAAILCSMQRAGTAMCHLAEIDGLAFDVLFVDTEVLHAETLRVRDELARTHRKLQVITLYPRRGFAEQTAAEGLLYFTHEGQEQCCEERKLAPLRRLKGRYDVLMSALRRAEGGARSRLPIFGIDTAMNALRVHPFANVSNADLDALYAAHPAMIQNPLHAMGFPTIGCFPCTTPVLPDEPARAGRWRHLANVAYCRINPIDRTSIEGEQAFEISLDERYTGLFQA